MLFPKVKEPFARYSLHALAGGLSGLAVALAVGIVGGLLLFILAKIQGNAYAEASDILSLLDGAIPLGAILGTVLGAIYGIVRKE